MRQCFWPKLAAVYDLCNTIFVMSSYTAILKQDGDFWIGWVEEVPGVNAQEKTKAALLASLKEILREALEFNREEAREAAQAGYTEEPIMV
jgi:predicted RNase H-like HicB family nuclease